MSNYTFTKQNFKELSSAVRDFSKQNPNATHAQFQQMLAQQLFSKPYEEVKATIFDDKDIVTIYECGGILFVMHKNKLRMTLDSNMAYDRKALIQKIRKSRIKCDCINILRIPFCSDIEYYEENNISEDFYQEIDEMLVPTLKYILDMIPKMGYDSDINIFDMIENAENFKISCVDLKDGLLCYSDYSNEKLCGDWENNFDSEGEDTLCLIVDETDDYFSFEQLARAKKMSDNSFYIDDGNFQYQFEFFK